MVKDAAVAIRERVVRLVHHQQIVVVRRERRQPLFAGERLHAAHGDRVERVRGVLSGLFHRAAQPARAVELVRGLLNQLVAVRENQRLPPGRGLVGGEVGEDDGFAGAGGQHQQQPAEVAPVFLARRERGLLIGAKFHDRASRVEG